MSILSTIGKILTTGSAAYTTAATGNIAGAIATVGTALQTGGSSTRRYGPQYGWGLGRATPEVRAQQARIRAQYRQAGIPVPIPTGPMQLLSPLNAAQTANYAARSTPVPTVTSPVLTNAIKSGGSTNMSMYGSSFAPALPGLGTIVSTAGKVLRSTPGAVAAGVAGTAAVDYLMDDCRPRKRYRRMNYMNGKAAKRAIRRIKGVRKICADIERQLPKRTVKTKATGGKTCR